MGMKIGERYHDIHLNRLGLQCAVCHSPKGDTYRDPLAQTYNPVDKRACLSCHKEGSVQPFYGEEWEKAGVTR